MRDIFTTRRTYNIKCRYWKRNTVGVGNSDKLIHNVNEDGIFYAKELDNRMESDSNDVGGVFHLNYGTTQIKTFDIVDIEADDLVEFNEELYRVERVTKRKVNKQTEFGRKTVSNDTIIYLRR